MTNLTLREREVLYWAACGKTIDETARILERAHSTVHTHRCDAIVKLGAANICGAVARAVAFGLIDLGK